MSSSPYKFAITGPESTGKSTLAQQLAVHFQGVYVPEYARAFLENRPQAYTAEDIEYIALQQMASVEAASQHAYRLLIADTELLVIKIWYEHAFGPCPAWIEQAIQEQTYHGYLLMDVDLPWTPDPQREHPDLRDYFFKKYQAELDRYGFPYTILSGNHLERLSRAQEKIDFVLKNTQPGELI